MPRRLRLALALVVAASSLRTAHLPRAELERAGAGAAEGALGASSALYDTVAVRATAALPAAVAANAAFLFTPKGSAAVVAGAAFTPDVRGD